MTALFSFLLICSLQFLEFSKATCLNEVYLCSINKPLILGRGGASGNKFRMTLGLPVGAVMVKLLFSENFRVLKIRTARTTREQRTFTSSP